MSVLATPYTVASTVLAAGVIGFTLLAGGPSFADEGTNGASRPAPGGYETIAVTAPRPARIEADATKQAPKPSDRAEASAPVIKVDLEAAASVATRIARQSL